MDDAGPALAGVAADMGAGQVQMVAQEMDEEGSVLHLGRDGLAVHRQFDCRHAWYLPDVL
jgi:AMMECR1 domain-containing protein